MIKHVLFLNNINRNSKIGCVFGFCELKPEFFMPKVDSVNVFNILIPLVTYSHAQSFINNVGLCVSGISEHGTIHKKFHDDWVFFVEIEK